MIQMLFVLSLASLSPGAAPQPAGVAPPGSPRDDLPMGKLGFHVGTYLTIEGKLAEKGKVGRNTLQVDKVNDRPLEPAVEISIVNVDQLPRSTRCTLRGYESAKMIGLPEEVARKERLPLPQAVWQLYRYFIATSVVQPPALTLRDISAMASP